MAEGKILVIDDEEDMLENCSRLLKRFRYQALTCNDGAKAAELVRSEHPDVVLTDLKMPKMDGLEVLRAVKAADARVVVVVITGYATIENAVMAIKEGAFDYIPKPFSANQLAVALERAVAHKRLHDENQNLRSQLRSQFSFGNLVSISPTMTGVLRTVKKVARSDANVLVLGESGTGKELVARSLHANSRRLDKPFVAVDCAALPATLLESELFGHEKGAFTGANTTKVGLFELADGGTLFLDEIGELSIGLQAKLLRVLQEHQFRRVGGTKMITVDVRVISATNRDLAKMVEQGEFRSDLYYRLNVIAIPLPPLRQRDGDIPILAKHFLRLFCEKMQRKPPQISPEALDLLNRYPWPGNVRQLQNVIEQILSLHDGEVILPIDLPESVRGEAARTDRPRPLVPMEFGGPFKEAKRDWTEIFEREYLSNLLKRHRGNISRAAEEAGIDRKTIHRMLRKHRIPAERTE